MNACDVGAVEHRDAPIDDARANVFASDESPPKGVGEMTRGMTESLALLTSRVSDDERCGADHVHADKAFFKSIVRRQCIR